MSIITFLKERRKERLVTQLSKLEKLSDEYSESVNAYDELIQSINLERNQIVNLWVPHYFRPYLEYLSKELTMYYNLYYYFTFLHNRTASKIKRLQNKLKKL